MAFFNCQLGNMPEHYFTLAAAQTKLDVPISGGQLKQGWPQALKPNQFIVGPDEVARWVKKYWPFGNQLV